MWRRLTSRSRPSQSAVRTLSSDTVELPHGLAIGIIMDGNRRWAQRRHVPVTAGHRAGATALRRTVEAAIELSVAELTVYAFSTENWSRPKREVNGIMRLFAEMLEREVPELHRQGVRVRFLGRREGLSEALLERMDASEQMTATNTTMTLAIAFNYGGRAEVVDAARALIERGQELTEDGLSQAMYEPQMRDPDLVIRTSGEQRMSNFLLWEAAYSEFVFIDTLWPDFGIEDLAAAIREFAERERRYGGRVQTPNDRSAV